MPEQPAQELIMKARAHWFADEPAAVPADAKAAAAAVPALGSH